MKTQIKNGISYYPPSSEVKPVDILISDGVIVKVVAPVAQNAQAVGRTACPSVEIKR